MDLALHNLLLYKQTDKEKQIVVKMGGWVFGLANLIALHAYLIFEKQISIVI